MILFIFSRTIDVLTTYLAIQEGGIGLEANPLMRFLISKGFVYFIIWQALVILTVGQIYKRSPVTKMAVKIVSWIGIVAAVSNFIGFMINI